MRVLVTGSTGTLGSSLMTAFANAGHQPIGLSRKAGSGARVADVGTGVGLAAAVAGIDAIVHAASDPRRAPRKTDVDGTLRLAAFGIPLLYVSIVGVDRHPYKYYQVKREGELALEGSHCPWTVLRATQFHSFLGGLLGMSRSGGEKIPGRNDSNAPLIYPKGWQFQPVSQHDVATRIVGLVEHGPTNSIEEFAGPSVFDSATLAKRWAAVKGGRPFGMRFPGKSSRAFREGFAIPLSTVPRGSVTWEDFLAGRDVD